LYNSRVSQAFLKNCLPSTLLKKLLALNPFEKRLERKPRETFEFETLISKPYRRDQPAQRLWHNPFEKRLDRKTQETA